jgi:hypothetical protein
MRNLEFIFDLLVVRRRGCKFRAFFYDAPTNVFCEILISRAPVHIRLSLFYSVFYPIKTHIHCFCAFFLIVPLLHPVAVVLSVSIGVGGCGFPNTYNVVRTTAPSLEFIKTAPIYASAAEDITCLRTLLMIKIAPLVSFLSVLVLLPM